MNNEFTQGRDEILEQAAWKNYENADTLYHLSGFLVGVDDFVPVMDSILTEGLKAGSTVETESGKTPAIWFFVDKKMAGSIAQGMLIQDFLLFSIRKDAIPRHTIRWDNVAESWAPFSFYALGERVPPGCIRFVDIFRVKRPRFPTTIFGTNTGRKGRSTLAS
jgi:hypothetical protein